MAEDQDKRLAQIERKLTRLLRMAEENAQALNTLYRRSIALAQMIEAVGEHREPRVTQALRTEIDASLMPSEFVALAEQDPDEFTARYGARMLDAVRRHGIQGVGTMGDLAPSALSRRKVLQ